MMKALTSVLPIIAALASSAGAEEPRCFEASDVFALEWAADPQVSPDGERIVYVRAAYDKLTDRSRGALRP